MPDLTDSLLPQIEKGKLPNLDLGSRAIHPAYNGRSILNLPASLSGWFGASALPHPALDIPGLDDMAEGIKQIVVVLIDAVSYHRFVMWLDGSAYEFSSLIEEGIFTPLTSVVPSTTCAALTSLWTGRSPAEHGILGYELFLREFGMVTNMITHAPASVEGHPGLLYQAGFHPETALPVPTLGPHLVEAGVDCHAFMHYSISGSGLSRMHFAGVERHTFGGIHDLWIGVRTLAERKIDQSRYIWVYFGGVDGQSHRHGPDSGQAEGEFGGFMRVLSESFIGDLPRDARRQTLLIVLADHGQITTSLDPHFELKNHPSLVRRLHILPTGENRLAYLYPRPGQVEAVIEYVEQTWPNQFVALDSSYALKAGLFGPGPQAEETPSRIGDRLLISQDRAYLWWANKDNPLVGRHGGVSSEEMLVPFLAARLA